MNYLHGLTEFMVANFPQWGCCHLAFDPQCCTLYIHPKTNKGLDAIIRDGTRLSQLDIGVEQFIVVPHDYPPVPISVIRKSVY